MIDWESFKNQMQTNPGKMLKSVMLLAGCLLLIWILVMIESGSPTKQTVHIHKSGRLDSLDMYSGRNPTNSSSTTQGQGTMNNNSGSGYYLLLPTALVFLVLVGGVWYWLHSRQTNTSGNLTGDIFTTIATQKIPGGQQLLVIKINGEYWVMATGGGQGTELLHRYSSEEWKTLERRPMKGDEEKTFWQTLKEKASQKKDNGGDI